MKANPVFPLHPNAPPALRGVEQGLHQPGAMLGGDEDPRRAEHGVSVAPTREVIREGDRVGPLAVQGPVSDGQLQHPPAGAPSPQAPPPPPPAGRAGGAGPAPSRSLMTSATKSPRFVSPVLTSRS